MVGGGNSLDFGDYFRSARRKAGFKRQVDLCRATGISQATISRLEDGLHKPSIENLSILSRALKVSMDELMQIVGYIDKNEDDQREESSLKREIQKLRSENERLREENRNLRVVIKHLTKGW